jgi:hypothetical protein
MKVIERLKAPTPKFWQKVQKVGVVLGVIGGALVTPFPPAGGVLITAGTIITALSQLTVEDGSNK